MAALVRVAVRRDVVARVAGHVQMFSDWGDMNKVIEDEIQRAKKGGGAMAIDRHVNKNGKMLVRDRLDLLIDAGTSLLELSPLAGYQMYGKDGIAAAGMIVRRKLFVHIHFVAQESCDFCRLASVLSLECSAWSSRMTPQSRAEHFIH